MTIREPGIEARFQSICPRCRDDITPGQRVIQQGDAYIHVTCASGQDDE
jgi:hypothetical protein